MECAHNGSRGKRAWTNYGRSIGRSISGVGYLIMYSVDVPPSNPEFESWVSVDMFLSKKEAIDFVMKYYGADSEGKISLVSPVGEEYLD